MTSPATPWQPFDRSVFRPGTYGALGICHNHGRKRVSTPAVAMRRFGPGWMPLCQSCLDYKQQQISERASRT
jgi:hypothetical protein